MKKKNLMMLALMGMTAGLSANLQAEEATKVDTKMDCSKLSSDEMAFSSKLNDSNRRMFCSKFSADQRKSAMMASCMGPNNCGAGRSDGTKKPMNANDAVQKVMKDNGMAMAEKREKAADALSQAPAPAKATPAVATPAAPAKAAPAAAVTPAPAAAPATK